MPQVTPACASQAALPSGDFDTASIRSSAPSYISDATTRVSRPPSISSFSTTSTATLTNTPRSDYVAQRHNSAPSLDQFRIPTWSTNNTRANPTARHYHSVATRRATIATVKEEEALIKAALSPNPLVALMEQKESEEKEEFLDGIQDGDGADGMTGGPGGRRLRPLEDPSLVGEEAAEKARKERLAREGRVGLEVLHREDRRWDWMIGQMKDWEEREESWNKFRDEVQQGKRGKLASRLGFKRGNRF